MVLCNFRLTMPAPVLRKSQDTEPRTVGGGSGGGGDLDTSVELGKVRIRSFGPVQKRLALSPRQFSKATENTSWVFKTVPPYDKLTTLPIYHQNHTNTLKKTTIFNMSLWKASSLLSPRRVHKS
ncbi:hypothetical protein E2C01_039747 [Portunus trituberculatus]|uniref:Uncharacterized protein n=1 Tax=Portunus trituberculatus TaxID=210409 RepID=A0A5B7FM35_PORTR|nr:hypothetical protein [Portunus trituberculatus]